MKFSTTLVATFASLSVAAPAHKRQADDTTISDVLPGITGEEPIEDTTTTTSSSSIPIDSATADALAAADPYDIYRVPAVTPTFPLEQNDFTGIQGVQSISDDNDIVDAAISNLSGVISSVPLTTGTSTVGEEEEDIPLPTATSSTTNKMLTVNDATVSDAQAQEVIDAAIRYAQQLPDPSIVVVPVPLTTGTPEIFVDPYLGNGTYSNSTTTPAAGAAAAATTTDGTDLVASLQALNDALASYQDLMNATASASDNVMPGKIKMLGDDMFAGIQHMAKRAELAATEQKNGTMNKVLRQRGMMHMANSTMFANQTEAVTSKTVMDKMGRNGVLERYVKMVAGN